MSVNTWVVDPSEMGLFVKVLNNSCVISIEYISSSLRIKHKALSSEKCSLNENPSFVQNLLDLAMSFIGRFTKIDFTFIY